jgi:hypothetical protein
MSGFFDSFFIWVTTLTAACAFADWCIGSAGRQRMRDRMGDWWLYLQFSTWQGLVSADAERVGAWLTRFFGGRFVSWKFIWRSTAVGLVIQFVSFVVVLLGAIWPPPGWRHLWDDLADPLGRDWLRFYGLFAVLIAVLDWLSIGTTIFFLKKMAGTHSGRAIFKLILLDLMVSVALFFAVTALGIYLVSLRPPTTTDDYGAEGWVRYYVVLLGVVPASIAAMWPSLLHLFICGIFLVSKLFAPVFRKPVSVLLLRFHESDQGVLTLLAVGSGAAAKLLEEWLKHLHLVA